MSITPELGGKEIRASGDEARNSANNGNGRMQLAALTGSKPTPDTELVVRERVLQALATHITAHADLLGVARGGGAHLREEDFVVDLCAESLSNPRLIDERECRARRPVAWT
jgi:hypothetical protein